jgi:putative photosynthetic complex assembly protein
MSSTVRPSFPRYPLFGAAALVAIALAGAGYGRLDHQGAGGAATVVAMRDFRFEDRADGAVIVDLVGEAQPFAVVTGQNGFLRGTLRGLARARRQDGIGSAAPFRLTAWADGRLTLDDPATGRHVELEAFGPTNEAVFARLLGGAGGHS